MGERATVNNARYAVDLVLYVLDDVVDGMEGVISRHPRRLPLSHSGLAVETSLSDLAPSLES